MATTKIKIAIAGIGTVGQGLLDLLAKYKKKEVQINISAIATRRKHKIFASTYKNTKIFKDAKDLLSFNDYDILVELIGGDEGVSKEIVFDALKKHKNVVTANKALVSKYWKEIRSLMINNQSFLKFEAAVAGGIPIIKVIDEFLFSNKIKRIY